MQFARKMYYQRLSASENIEEKGSNLSDYLTRSDRLLRPHTLSWIFLRLFRSNSFIPTCISPTQFMQWTRVVFRDGDQRKLAEKLTHYFSLMNLNLLFGASPHRLIDQWINQFVRMRALTSHIQVLIRWWEWQPWYQCQYCLSRDIQPIKGGSSHWKKEIKIYLFMLQGSSADTPPQIWKSLTNLFLFIVLICRKLFSLFARVFRIRSLCSDFYRQYKFI